MARLRTNPAVQTVTEDSRLHLQSTGIGPTGTAGDMTNVAKLTGATTFWRNGYSGQGIDVALLDSGVLPVEGLMTTNKLVIGPDLSLESQTPTLEDLDTFGHGTHMAGIIAGRDSGSTSSTYATDNTRFLGMAPGSRIVSIKLADAQGNTDVSQVIAAIDWVVAHSHDPGLNIRVLNLSFGTDSTQDYRLDPLAHAAEVAWNSGIVVVVSAGNGGGSTDRPGQPGVRPGRARRRRREHPGHRRPRRRPGARVLAARRDRSRASGLPTWSRPAPRSSACGRRARSSTSCTAPPAPLNDRFFKGSGTSQSAAVVSGAAALLLSQRPWLSPDQVKDILRRSAYDVAGGGRRRRGRRRPGPRRGLHHSSRRCRPPRCTPAAARWTRPAAPRRSRRTASR